MDRAWKNIAGLNIVVMGGFWLWGQDLLDRMAVTITPIAAVLPAGAVLISAAAWWVRNRRRRFAGWETAIDSALCRAEALTLLGIFAVAMVFAFFLDRLGHTPHQTFISASLAAAWDAGGIVLIIFCGACLIGGGRRGAESAQPSVAPPQELSRALAVQRARNVIHAAILAEQTSDHGPTAPRGPTQRSM